MRRDERHPGSNDIFVGIDLVTRQHHVVVLDAEGLRFTTFKVPHSKAGLTELVQRYRRWRCAKAKILARRATFRSGAGSYRNEEALMLITVSARRSLNPVRSCAAPVSGVRAALIYVVSTVGGRPAAGIRRIRSCCRRR